MCLLLYSVVPICVSIMCIFSYAITCIHITFDDVLCFRFLCNSAQVSYLLLFQDQKNWKKHILLPLWENKLVIITRYIYFFYNLFIIIWIKQKLKLTVYFFSSKITTAVKKNTLNCWPQRSSKSVVLMVFILKIIVLHQFDVCRDKWRDDQILPTPEGDAIASGLAHNQANRQFFCVENAF